LIDNFVHIIIWFCSKIMDAYVRAMYHEYRIRREDGREIREWFVVRISYVGRDTSADETKYNDQKDSEPK